MEIFQLERKFWFTPRSLFKSTHTQSQTFTHSETGSIALEHLIWTTLPEYYRNLTLYHWRYQNNFPIIPIYNIEIVQLLRNQAQISVLCQKQWFFLDEIFMYLTCEELFSVLREVFKGVKAASEKLGYFGLSLKMVGINKEGVIKIWINQDLASNNRQIPLSNQKDQNSYFLQSFDIISKIQVLFGSFIQKCKQQCNSFQKIQQILNKHIRDNSIQVVQRVNIAKLIALKDNGPSCFLKSGRQSTQLTQSQMASINSKDSVIQSQKSIGFNQTQKFKVKARKRKRKMNTINCFSNYSPIFSPTHSKISPQILQFQSRLTSPIQSLGLQSKLQESIVFESESDKKKVQFDINSLQKLGKIGKFCESLTPQQFILEQFKQIYE